MTGIPVICDADPTSFKSLRALNRAIWSVGVTFDRDPQSGDAGLLALNHLGTGSGLGPRVAVKSPLRRILPMTGLPGEHQTGSSGQTVGDRIVDARGETFVSTGRNFCSDHVRLKYPRFARYEGFGVLPLCPAGKAGRALVPKPRTF